MSVATSAFAPSWSTAMPHSHMGATIRIGFTDECGAVRGPVARADTYSHVLSDGEKIDYRVMAAS